MCNCYTWLAIVSGSHLSMFIHVMFCLIACLPGQCPLHRRPDNGCVFNTSLWVKWERRSLEITVLLKWWHASLIELNITGYDNKMRKRIIYTPNYLSLSPPWAPHHLLIVEGLTGRCLVNIPEVLTEVQCWTGSSSWMPWPICFKQKALCLYSCVL